MIRRIQAAAAVAALFALAVPAAAQVDIEEVTTDAGFEAWLVEDDSVPFVSLEIRFVGGAVLDPEGQAGVTNLMMGLLEEGAGERDARAFAAAEEELAASFGYDANHDSVSVSARFLTENRDEAVALLRDSLVAPRFDADAIERVRGQVISGLRSAQTDPDEIAERRAADYAFGDHPYARPVSGTLETVPHLSRESIVAAHAAALVQDRAVIAAAGDISADELSALVDSLLADLPESGPGLPTEVEIPDSGGVTVVPFDTPQSVAIFGHSGIDRHDPDFFPAYVLNHILGGGGFESRLMEEVREKRGLTYGVYSYLATRDYADLMMGRVASANERMAETVQVIRDTWARTAEDGVSDTELEDAKTYLTGAYPLRFDGNGAIADILVGMQLQDLSPDYVNTRNDMIEAVTAEDIQRVAGELMKPDALHFTIVGQPEGLDGEATQ
ncbi:Peptidase M16 inactive domain protein [Roseivivax jejudonensis]|uniref:Peptidase M16 inactive domain protein n=1 Tax=Roseivivax jejudonensis TaxID=1529041 RepID=A0A1X6ZSX1_9RHOB|nr:pitrilysin family protein [Roseivivax jejudonensis]SLN60751.1 Peptidase M16 inactive domain protein [Roseivivax jejudonensis]